MTQDLIKTPVTMRPCLDRPSMFNIVDADGNDAIWLLAEFEAELIVNTLNVLSGKLSGDPNGTATKEERELWRQTAIAWSNKVEKAAQELLDCFERDEDNAEWGTGFEVPIFVEAEGKTDNDRDKALYVLEILLSTGVNGQDNRAEVKRKLSCL